VIIVDASAALRWFLPVRDEPLPVWRPASEQVLLAPDLFAIEVRSAALKYLRSGEITFEAASDMVAAIDQMVPILAPMTEHKNLIWTLACELDHSPYDCTYLALCLHHNALMVTADKRLLRKLENTRHAGKAFHVTDTLSASAR
jgi:predicted nucleic acid-binding protein